MRVMQVFTMIVISFSIKSVTATSQSRSVTDKGWMYGGMKTRLEQKLTQLIKLQHLYKFQVKHQ